MKIKRSDTREDKIYAQLIKYFKDRERESPLKTGEYHVSDLMNPRQAFFKYTDPQKITRKEIGFFLSGMAHHFVMQEGMNGETEKELLFTVKLKDKDSTVVQVIGHVDKYPDYPIELKSSRKWTIPEEPPEHYVDQLKAYCTMADLNVGEVVVFFYTPNRKWNGETATEPEIVVWEIKFGDDELHEAKKLLKRNTRKLHTALVNEDFSELPLCTDWLCGKKYRGKPTVNCKWYEDCKPEGRYPKKFLPE